MNRQRRLTHLIPPVKLQLLGGILKKALPKWLIERLSTHPRSTRNCPVPPIRRHGGLPMSPRVSMNMGYSSNLRFSSETKLQALGPTIAPYLAKQLNSSSPLVATVCANVLGKFGSDAIEPVMQDTLFLHVSLSIQFAHLLQPKSRSK